VVSETVGSDFDTVLAVYRGTSMSALTEVGCNNDIDAGNVRSRVQFDAVAGETYYFQVGGAGGGTGTLNFSATQPGGSDPNPDPNPNPDPQPPVMPPITPDPLPDPLPDPTPEPQPSAAVSLVGRSRLAVTRSGMARVPVVCRLAGGAPFCEGRATLLSGGRSIGSEPYDLSGDARRTLSIGLRGATRRTLRRRGTLRVSLRLRTVLDGVVLQSERTPVTLRAPKRR
jgi:hypothetical protein